MILSFTHAYQQNKSLPRAIGNVESYCHDIKRWMMKNKRLMSRKLRYFSADHLLGGRVPVDSLLVGEASIPFSSVVKNLGVTLDAAPSFGHVSAIVKSCFFHDRSLSKVCSYLTRKAANSIAVSLILSKLDFCNSLLAGLPETQTSTGSTKCSS